MSTHIGGWSSYAFHSQCAINSKLDDKLRVSCTKQTTVKQCPGCGARKSEVKANRTICSYCKNDLSIDSTKLDRLKQEMEFQDQLFQAHAAREMFRHSGINRTFF